MTIKWVNHPFGGALAYQANTPWRGVIHTTESPSLPSYSNGAVAPQITFDIKNRVAYKHYDYKKYAGKSLKHPSGTPVTNTTRCVQIEIIGYCDPAQSSSPLYIGKWTDSDYAALNELLHEIEAEVGIPHTFVPNWKAYPSSYGNNGVRMDNTDWAKFSGWCGHQHVPNNVHGDPGAINVSKLLEVDDVSAYDVWAYHQEDSKGNATTPQAWAYLKAADAKLNQLIALLSNTTDLAAKIAAALPSGSNVVSKDDLVAALTQVLGSVDNK